MKMVQSIIVVPTQKSAHAPRNFNCRQAGIMLDVHQWRGLLRPITSLMLASEIQNGGDKYSNSFRSRAMGFPKNPHPIQPQVA
jgi:hypothetical protein